MLTAEMSVKLFIEKAKEIALMTSVYNQVKVNKREMKNLIDSTASEQTAAGLDLSEIAEKSEG